jgi:hypothetical protein
MWLSLLLPPVEVTVCFWDGNIRGALYSSIVIGNENEGWKAIYSLKWAYCLLCWHLQRWPIFCFNLLLDLCYCKTNRPLNSTEVFVCITFWSHVLLRQFSDFYKNVMIFVGGKWLWCVTHRNFQVSAMLQSVHLLITDESDFPIFCFSCFCYQLRILSCTNICSWYIIIKSITKQTTHLSQQRLTQL